MQPLINGEQLRLTLDEIRFLHDAFRRADQLALRLRQDLEFRSLKSLEWVMREDGELRRAKTGTAGLDDILGGG